MDDFYASLGQYRLVSINNHALNLHRLGDFRLTRFIRDPRDLVVSGYLYHRKGKEAWSRLRSPGPDDWAIVNGVIPKDMKPGESYSGFLKRVDLESGLMAEIEFREKHFNSMMEWPDEHSQVKLLRYEDIIGREPAAFSEILEFYGLGPIQRMIGRGLAWKYSAKRQDQGYGHIRDPSTAQWRQYFTRSVNAYFMDRHPGLLKKYGYT